MIKAHHQSQFRHFDKFNFVEAFIAASQNQDPKIREEKKKEAVIIAEAIEETQGVIFENLATKQDLAKLELATKQEFTKFELATKQEFTKFELATKQELVILENKLVIKLTAIMATLMTFLPLINEFLRKLFG